MQSRYRQREDHGKNFLMELKGNNNGQKVVYPYKSRKEQKEIGRIFHTFWKEFSAKIRTLSGNRLSKKWKHCFTAWNDKATPTSPFTGVNQYAKPNKIKHLTLVRQEKERVHAEYFRRVLHEMH